MMILRRMVVVVAAAAALQPYSRPRRAVARAASRSRGAALAVAPAPVWVAGSCASGILWKPLVTRAMDAWYDAGGIAKPSWAPPRRWFPIVWRANYFLIGLAAHKRAAFAGLPPVALAHFALHMCWAPLFFHFRALKAAALLNAALVATLAAALPAFRAAGAAALLYPYLAWITFATALSVEIARLNPRGVAAE